MISNTKTGIEIESMGDETESLSAGIDSSNLGFLFDLVSKQIYKNPIGSIVRELTSNCFDSHVEAGVTKPVKITIAENELGQYISFTDYGVGMSPERVREVYMKYFSSTKRDTNDQIGTFGLGSKSPFAYTDVFYITTRVDGTEYEYMFHKGTEVPTLECLDEHPTDKGNGTTIRIQIADYYDVDKFREQLKAELCYFDEVYYDGCGIDNEYIIVDGKFFKYRNDYQYDQYMHIILGKVSYPIDWRELNEPRVAIAVGVKFDIGELQVTPSRESIRYTDEAKALISNRIKSALGEILKISKKQCVKEYDNLYKYCNESPRTTITLDEENDIRLDLSNHTAFVTQKVFTPFPAINRVNTDVYDSSNFTLIFEPVKSLRANGKGTNNARYSTNHYISSGYTIVFLDKPQEKIRDAYLKEIHGDVLYVRWRRFAYRDLKHYWRFKQGEVGLSYLMKSFKVALMNQLRMENTLTSGNCMIPFKVYSEVVPPTEWVDEYRAKNRKKKIHVDGHIEVKNVDRDGSLSDKKVPLDDLESYTGFIIYGFRGDREKLTDIAKFLYARYGSCLDKANKHIPYRVYLITLPIAKYFRKPNMCQFNNLTPQVRIVRNMVTVLKIKKMLSGYDDNTKLTDILTLMNPTIGYALQSIQEYCKNNVREMAYLYRDPSAFANEMYELAETYNLWNPEIMPLVNQVEAYINKAPLILEIRYDNFSAIRNRIFGQTENIDEVEALLKTTSAFISLANYLKKCGNHVEERWFTSTLELPPVIEEPLPTGEIVIATEPEVVDEYEFVEPIALNPLNPNQNVRIEETQSHSQEVHG